jgi:D-alanyl-D-alanine dipeptidase
LVTIPADEFARLTPHPYIALGAPYGEASPWQVRRGVLDALRAAQRQLRQTRPDLGFLLFDAYRPNQVQHFMVEWELTIQAEAAGFDANALSAEQRDRLLTEKVYRLFAIPSDDPRTPPPHSTGAAIDLTLCDDTGREIDMGSPVDENSERSLPDHFAAAQYTAGRQAHANRSLLNDVLTAAGFVRNPSEWWHFSIGDQLAVGTHHGLETIQVARYGNVRFMF